MLQAPEQIKITTTDFEETLLLKHNSENYNLYEAFEFELTIENKHIAKNSMHYTIKLKNRLNQTFTKEFETHPNAILFLNSIASNILTDSNYIHYTPKR